MTKTVQLKNGNQGVLRGATGKDAQKCHELLRTTVAEGHFSVVEIEELSRDPAETLSQIHDAISNPRGLFLVLELNEQIIGQLTFYPGRRRRHHHQGEFSMVVNSDYRSQGVGLHLLNELIQWAREHSDIEKISLHVNSDNEKALGLYKKMGFKVEGKKIKDIKLSDGRYKDSLFMGLWVGPSLGNIDPE